MARGDMRVENATFGSGAEILNRPPFKGVSMTIDFAGATGVDDGYKKDTTSGEFFVPAGMPISKLGKPVNKTPFSETVGILLVDVYEHRPQGTVLTEAYINKERAQKNSGCNYDGALIVALVNAGCRIRIEGDDETDFVIGKIQSGE